MQERTCHNINKQNTKVKACWKFLQVIQQKVHHNLTMKSYDCLPVIRQGA